MEGDEDELMVGFMRGRDVTVEEEATMSMSVTVKVTMKLGLVVAIFFCRLIDKIDKRRE